MKKRAKACLLFVLICFSINPLFGQDSTLAVSPALLIAIDPHSATAIPSSGSVIIDVPITKGHQFYELRYNYDGDNTLGVYGGYSFFKGKGAAKHVITPQIGVLIGEKEGISFQLYYQLKRKKIGLDFQQQYSVVTNSGKSNFYFNWLSMQYNLIGKWLVGLSAQSSLGNAGNAFDAGYLIGYQRRRIGFVLFHFKAYDAAHQYFYFGTQNTL